MCKFTHFFANFVEKYLEDMSAILEDLNREQRQAVECVEGPVLIVAGAGSGKTRVLTSRIAYMIENGTDPSRILALTFTKKAAGEMKERIGQMVGERAARRIWMGTFHSVFIRFLREFADSIGFPATFTIYDTADSVSAVVYQQRPSASEQVRLGSEVTLSLTNDPSKVPAQTSSKK